MIIPLDNPHLVAFKNCQNWLKSHGGHDAFRFKYISESNRCTSAAYDIAAGETVCFVPSQCMLKDYGTYHNVLPLRIEHEISMGKDSKFYLYLETLPTDLSECSNLWPPETLRYLDGSPLKDIILEGQKDNTEHYSTLDDAIKERCSLKKFLECVYFV